MQDEWGHDPGIQKTRRIFSSIEEAQGEFLKKIKISPFDARLRHIREIAKKFFEQSSAVANRRGMYLDEAEYQIIYLNCLARAFHIENIEVPQEALPENDKALASLVWEAVS
ncbi:MAG: hypothetical protein BWK80_20445 [Desulfobacteraceae bacterium IS3]|nr:MAG: hypothetical protein BWK80_20445 [Desulfobacteraceae bacterium IS3]